MLTGYHDHTTWMWIVDTSNEKKSTEVELNLGQAMQIKNVYEYNKKKNMVTYLHKAEFSPVKSTWIKDINAGFYNSWPGLTTKLHLPKYPATIKGHLCQTSQNIYSTKKNNTISLNTNPSEPIVIIIPPPEEDVRANLVTMKVIEVSGIFVSNQTDRFPITSSRGNKYILVMYDDDSNTIISEPIKSRSQAEIIRAQANMHTYLID